MTLMSDIAVSTRKLVRCFILVAALAQSLVLAGWGFPLQSKSNPSPHAQRNESRHQIEQLEDKWRDAVLKGDVAVLDSLLADDYVAILPDGTLQTKDQSLAIFRTGQKRFNSLDVSELKIRFYGKTALITCLVEAEGVGQEGNFTGSFRYTRVYARDARGVWKIVNFEASRLRRPRESK